MQTVGSTTRSDAEPVNLLAQRVRTHLCAIACQSKPITYQVLAQALDVLPPNTIHQLTVALEYLMEEDADALRPLISALVVSKVRGGLPAPGFFECAELLGRLNSHASEHEAAAFFASEFNAAVEYWGADTDGARPHI